MIRPGSNGDLVPKAVNVFGHSPSEGRTGITCESLHVVRVGSAFEQGALLLKRLLVDLALKPHADFVAQNHPVRTQFRVRQSLPESLAEAQQQLHRDIMLFDPRCRDRDFQPVIGYGPSRGHTRCHFRRNRDPARSQSPRHGARYGAHGRADEFAYKRCGQARAADQCPSMSKPKWTSRRGHGISAQPPRLTSRNDSRLHSPSGTDEQRRRMYTLPSFALTLKKMSVGPYHWSSSSSTK